MRSRLCCNGITFSIIFDDLTGLNVTLVALFFFCHSNADLIHRVHRTLHGVVNGHVSNCVSSINAAAHTIMCNVNLATLTRTVLTNVNCCFSNTPDPVLLAVIAFVVTLVPFNAPFI